MSVITISSISTSGSTSIDDTIQHLHQLLASSPAQHTIGTKIQDPSTIQITSQWPDTLSATTLQSSSDYTSFLSLLSPYSPTTLTSTLTSTPLSAPLTEFVQCDFPTSTLSPQTIESDFARFEAAFRQRGAMADLGEVFLATGWSEEHVDKNGEKVKSWVVLRGWESMGAFEEAVQTSEFKGAVGILVGWGVPFELWHVETKERREEV